MDAASVEAAYASADLPIDTVTLSWNEDATKLTVTPNDKLEYAGGSAPADVVAKTYAVTIGAGAMDVAQNPMGEDATLAFSTLRDIMVIGHTDTVGGLAYNDKLSLARAEKLRDMLVGLGIPAERVAAAGRGKREPLVPTEDNVSEPRNRRVEINVR